LNCTLIVNFWHSSCSVHFLRGKSQALRCKLIVLIVVTWNTRVEFITSIHGVGILFLQRWIISSWVNHVYATWSLRHNLHFSISWRLNIGFFHFSIVMSKISSSLSWFISLFGHWRFSCFIIIYLSRNITEINLGIQHQLLIIKIDRVVSLLLENMFIHCSQRGLIFFKFMMGIWWIKFTETSRLKLPKINRLIILLS
jgi:hypothetical protein